MTDKKFAYVTSFSAKGYDEYGFRFLETFRKRVAQDLFLVLDQRFDVIPKWSSIQILENQYAIQIQDTYRSFKGDGNYRFAPNRFCYKTSAVETALKAAKLDYDYLIWLDADSVIKADDLTEYLATLVPGDSEIASFFDRERSYGYSETGIVIFNLRNQKTANFVERWNAAFVSGSIFGYSEWHDAFYFSHLVRSMPPNHFRHLCIDLNLKSSHPIYELKPLRLRIEHLKGDIRKRLGFSPEKYKIPSAIFRKLLNNR